MVFPLIGLATALVSEFAPTLIRKMAGDGAAEVAEQVIGLATKVTGKVDPEDALAALRADPQAVLDFKSEAAGLEVRLEEAHLKDRQNARDRDVKLAQAGYHNWRADIMLGMAFIALIVIIILVWMGRLDIPDQVFALLNMAAGLLLGMIKDAFSFEFGSSRSSKDKTTLLGG